MMGSSTFKNDRGSFLARHEGSSTMQPSEAGQLSALNNRFDQIDVSDRGIGSRGS